MPESSKEPIFEPPFNPDKKQELSESAQAIQNDLSDLLLELKNMRGLVGSDGKLILAAELWQKVLGFFWKDDSENSLTRAENFRANVRAIGERLAPLKPEERQRIREWMEKQSTEEKNFMNLEQEL